MHCPRVVSGTVWTPDQVRARLKAMADVLVRSAFPANGRPSTQVTMALDVLRSIWEETPDPTSAPVSRPSNVEHDQCSEALGWTLWLGAAARKLVVARSAGVKWRRLERLFGFTERTLRDRFDDAVRLIVVRLNGAAKK